MNDLKIEFISVKSLTPYDKNTRKHTSKDVEKIKKSIQNYGFNDPVGVWSEKNIIIEGHGRVMAAKELGLEYVPAIRLDHMTDEQRREYAIAHNRTAEFSEWDIDVLTEELKYLDFGDLDLEFDIDLEEETTEAKEDDYDVVVPEEPKTKLGDVYILGNHRLLCGDSTKLEDVEKLMNGNKADLLITDPPYNVALGMGGSVDEARKRHRRTDGLVIMNDKMSDSDFRQFLVNVFNTGKSVMKAGAAFYIWHADNEGYNFRGACRDVGWQVRETLIWNKNSITLGRQDYQWKHEPCLYGWNEGASHCWYSDRKQSTVIDMPRPTKSVEHPTMKPVPLFDYQIQNSSKAGDIVLDLFGGSGTTMIACEQNGRSAYLMELDPRYCDVIVDRWETLTGKKAVLETK